MTLLQQLTVCESPLILDLVIRQQAGGPCLASGFDNRPTWDNAGGKGFDNKPSWDNWSKR